MNHLEKLLSQRDSAVTESRNGNKKLYSFRTRL